MLECWTTNNTHYINAFNGITAQTVELTQSTSYSAQKAGSTGGTKTVMWEALPVYENPLGEEIATVAMLKNKQDKLTAGSNITISGNTISATDTNTSHSHSAGVGLVGSGNAGTSGTYNYKVKLRNETALTVDSAAATTTSGRVYPVAVDKSGYLSVNVPWNDTNSTYDAGTGLNLSHGVFSAKLNNTASLGTIGTTSKLYAVGVDANGKLCVKVPWTDTNTIKSATLSDNILTLELS